MEHEGFAKLVISLIFHNNFYYTVIYWNTNPDIRYRASLDRIDSSKGYIKGNVQFVATPINYLKGTMSDETTKAYLREIAASIFIED